jgi:hypothetical protein
MELGHYLKRANYMKSYLKKLTVVSFLRCFGFTFDILIKSINHGFHRKQVSAKD